MYKKNKILALITARGGSKGIPGKNIKALGPFPLIAWTIKAAQKSKYIDRLILSTDDNSIAQVAQEYNCEVPFIRPKELALDTSTSMEVIFHALEQINESFDYLLLLQPTSPFRTTYEIDDLIKTALDNHYPMMVSVVRQKKPPYYSFEIDSANKLKQILPIEKQLRRQDFPPTYEHNGALYFSEITFLKNVKTYITPQTFPYIMSGSTSYVDLDTHDDWLWAEFLIKQGFVNTKDF